LEIRNLFTLRFVNKCFFEINTPENIKLFLELIKNNLIAYSPVYDTIIIFAKLFNVELGKVSREISHSSGYSFGCLVNGSNSRKITLSKELNSNIIHKDLILFNDENCDVEPFNCVTVRTRSKNNGILIPQDLILSESFKQGYFVRNLPDRINWKHFSYEVIVPANCPTFFVKPN
jgi:hypothetical protein